MGQVQKTKYSKNKIKTIIVFGGLTLSALTSFLVIWDRWNPTSKEILLEPLTHIQTPFTIDPRLHINGVKGPELDINWIAYFSITNLINEPIVIEDISVDFTADHTLSTEWRLLGEKIKSPLYLWAYVTDDERYFRDKDTTIPCTFQPGPFIIPAGTKKIFGFSLSYYLYKNRQKIIPTDIIKTQVLVQRLIGGNLLKNGTVRAVYGPIKVKLKIARKGNINFKSETLLWVVGSFYYYPR